jgi:flavodoxin
MSNDNTDKMKIAVRYFSRTGHTKKMAAVISDITGVKAETLDSPITEEVDILFFGSAVYVAGIDKKVKQFIASLDGKVKNVICFSSAAVLSSSYPQVKGLLKKQHIPVDEREFHCRGQFMALHKGRPDENDLDELRKFVNGVINTNA